MDRFAPLDLTQRFSLLAALEYDPLPDALPTACPIVKIPEAMADLWDLDSQHILVRSKSEQAALLENSEGSSLFLVTGQPGIRPLSLTLYHHAQNLTFNQENLAF